MLRASRFVNDATRRLYLSNKSDWNIYAQRATFRIMDRLWPLASWVSVLHISSGVQLSCRWAVLGLRGLLSSRNSIEESRHISCLSVTSPTLDNEDDDKTSQRLQCNATTTNMLTQCLAESKTLSDLSVYPSDSARNYPTPSLPPF
jgi:hypothetical protein